MLGRSLLARVFGNGRVLAATSVLGAVAFATTVACWPEGSQSADDPQGPLGGANDKQYWTGAGATGIVDDADDGLAAFTASSVSFHSSAPSAASLVLRYNVTANPNLAIDAYQPFIQLRFRDNGTAARILGRLKQHNVVTGVTTTLLTIDSNDYAESGDYQLRFVDEAAGTLLYNFQSNIYYVELTMTRTSTAGTPAVSMVMVGRY